MQLNVLDDLAEAMKALDGKKSILQREFDLRWNARSRTWQMLRRGAKSSNCLMKVSVSTRLEQDVDRPTWTIYKGGDDQQPMSHVEKEALDVRAVALNLKKQSVKSVI